MRSRFGSNLVNDTVREFYRNVRGGPSVMGTDTGMSQVVSAADECLSPELNRSFSHRLTQLTSSNDVSDQLLSQEFEPMVYQSTTSLDIVDVSKGQVKRKLQDTRAGACKQYASPNLRSSSDDNSLNFAYQYTRFQQCAIANMCANEIRSCMESNSDGSFSTCFASRDYGSKMERCVSKVRESFEQQS